MATDQARTPGTGNRTRMLAALVTLAALLLPGMAYAQTSDTVPPRPPRAYEAWQKAQEYYRNADYEGAARFFQEADAAKGQLAVNVQADLAAEIQNNNKALQSSRDGGTRLRQAEELLKSNQLQEAAAIVRAESANQYLRPSDRALLGQLTDQLRSRGVTGLAATPAGTKAGAAKAPETAKQDYSTLVHDARVLLVKTQLDEAEAKAKQAEKVGSGVIPYWLHPWDDNHSKVLRDIQDARVKLAAEKKAHDLAAAQKAQPDKAPEQPSLLMQPIIAVKSFFTPAPTPPAPKPADQVAPPPGGPSPNAVAGPAVTPPGQAPGNNAPVPQVSPETLKVRQLVAQGDDALKHNDLVLARKCAMEAKAIHTDAWWESQKADNLLAEIEKRQPVQQASGKSLPPAPPAAGPMDIATARTKLKEARVLFGENKLDEADRLAAQVNAAKLKWGLFEDTPETLHKDIQQARKKVDQVESVKLLADARKLLAAGNYQDARVKAWKARQLHGPYTIFDTGDRPDRLLSDIDSAEAKHPNTNPANSNPTGTAGNMKSSGMGIPGTGDVALSSGKVADPKDPPAPASPTLTTAALAAKQRAQALLSEARALEKQGNLFEAQRKAEEAQTAALEAYRGGAAFTASEDTPDNVMRSLAQGCNARVKNLVSLAEEQAFDPAKMPKALAHLQEARQLALAFHQDTTLVDQKIDWLARRQNPGAVGVAQASNVVPEGPQKMGLEMLEHARAELRAGKTEMARKLTEQAFDLKYGVQPQAYQLLNTIDAEEFAQHKLDSDRAFLAGYDAFNRKDYRQAQNILAQIEPRLLTEEKQHRLRDLMMDDNMQARGSSNHVQLVRSDDMPSGPNNPGKASVTDMQPEGDPALERYKAMSKLEFDMLTKDGLDAQRRALQRAQAGDFDGAVEILRAYSAAVNESKLTKDQQVVLNRPVDRYVQQFQTRKAQLNFEKEQKVANGDLTGGRDREKQRTLKQQELEKELAQMTDNYQQLMKEGKFPQAHAVALHGLDLDRENPAFTAMATIASLKMQEERNAKNEREKNRAFDEYLDDNPGPLVDMEHPVAGNLEAIKRAKNRKDYGIGIKTDLHDPIERKIARAVEERKVTVNFVNTPLYQVRRDLETVIGGDINIVFDNQALKEEGIRLDEPLTQSLNNMPLRSALNILLRDAKLTWVIQNHSITITTEANAKGNSKVVTYSVADLVVPIENHPSPLCELDNARWDRAKADQQQGNNLYGPTQPYTSGAYGLPAGSQIGNPSGGPAGGPNSMMGGRPPKPVPGEDIHELLIRLITHTIEPNSWSDVGGKGTIQYFPLGLALIVNQTQDIQEQIVDLLTALRRLQDLEVAIEMRLVSVSEAFFERIGVDFSMDILHHETTQDPILLSGNFQPNGFVNQFRPNNFVAGLTPAGTFTPDLGIPIKTGSFDFGIPPFGGYPGTLGADGGLSLGLAFLSDIQVYMMVEAAQGDRRTNTMQAPKITVFNGQTANINVGDELEFLDSIQYQNVNGIPVFTPQQNRVGYGVFLTVTPVVSADRRFVRLNLNPTLRNLVSATVPLLPVQQVVPQLFYDQISPPQPQLFQLFFQQPSTAFVTLNTTVVVPDGGTVLMGGLKTLVEGRNEFGPPVLSKIPYLSRLFKNVGYGREAQSLMIMVTARIIINEEEEQEFLGNIPRIPR